MRYQEQIYSAGSLVHIKGLATAGNAEAGEPMEFAGAVNDGTYGKWVIGCALFPFVRTARVIRNYAHSASVRGLCPVPPERQHQAGVIQQQHAAIY